MDEKPRFVIHSVLDESSTWVEEIFDYKLGELVCTLPLNCKYRQLILDTLNLKVEE